MSPLALLSFSIFTLSIASGRGSIFSLVERANKNLNDDGNNNNNNNNNNDDAIPFADALNAMAEREVRPFADAANAMAEREVGHLLRHSEGEMGRMRPFTRTDPHERPAKRMEDLVMRIYRNETLYREWVNHVENWLAQGSNTTGVPRFPCPRLTPTPSVPNSVHRLRPADIKIVGALGDSLTAGSGILARTPLGLLTVFRGYSWSGGGDADRHSVFTMPNLLKEYNPEIRGFSVGSQSSLFKPNRDARLNEAIPGDHADDMPSQARSLLQNLRDSSLKGEIDFEKDWKLVTILIGQNDLCDYFVDKKRYSTSAFRSHIEEALDILSAIPRIFVNLVEPLNLALVRGLNNGVICDLIHAYECRHLAFGQAHLEEAEALRDSYISVLHDLSSSPKYNDRDDFAIVIQPFLRNSTLPRLPDGSVDISYFAPDCFHLSARGQGMAAKALWNNMFQAVGRKSLSWNAESKIVCPSEESPYLRTKLNYNDDDEKKKKTPEKRMPRCIEYCICPPEDCLCWENGDVCKPGCFLGCKSKMRRADRADRADRGSNAGQKTMTPRSGGRRDDAPSAVVDEQRWPRVEQRREEKQRQQQKHRQKEPQQQQKQQPQQQQQLQEQEQQLQEQQEQQEQQREQKLPEDLQEQEQRLREQYQQLQEQEQQPNESEQKENMSPRLSSVKIGKREDKVVAGGSNSDGDGMVIKDAATTPPSNQTESPPTPFGNSRNPLTWVLFAVFGVVGVIAITATVHHCVEKDFKPTTNPRRSDVKSSITNDGVHNPACDVIVTSIPGPTVIAGGARGADGVSDGLMRLEPPAPAQVEVEVESSKL